MNHNNIVKLYDQHETETEYQMYMEYCDKADSLTEKIREVSSNTFIVNKQNDNNMYILQKLTPVGNNQKLLSYAEDVLQGLSHVH